MSREPILRFGEKVLALLDQGSFTATYKYALLLAIIDSLVELTDGVGSPPSRISTRFLAGKVANLYWPQCRVFAGTHRAGVLRQNTSGQAEIVKVLQAFREAHPRPGTLAQVRRLAPEELAAMLDHVEWKLVQMPIPRLQRFGAIDDRFVYDFDWDEHITRRQLFAGPQRHIEIRPGAGESLVQLSGLLRPLIERQWLLMVAALNKDLVDESRLAEFMFGLDRTSLSRLRSELIELQDGRCFYCDTLLRGVSHVDHFLPWARHPDNGIANLVIADAGCNGRKRDFLAAPTHLQSWVARATHPDTNRALLSIAERRSWDCDIGRTMGAARALYSRLSPDSVLWLEDATFVNADLPIIRRILVSASATELAAEE